MRYSDRFHYANVPNATKCFKSLKNITEYKNYLINYIRLYIYLKKNTN